MGQPPIQREALAGPAGRRHSPSRVQRANVPCSVVKGMPESQPAGDAPLHAAEGQGPDQPNEAPAQAQVRLAAAAAVHADPLALHGLQLGLDREDEHLEVGQGVPAVAAAGPRQAPDRRREQVSGA